MFKGKDKKMIRNKIIGSVTGNDELTSKKSAFVREKDIKGSVMVNQLIVIILLIIRPFFYAQETVLFA